MGSMRGGEGSEGTDRERHERHPRQAGQLPGSQHDIPGSTPQAVEVRPEGRMTHRAEPLEHRMECVNCGFEFDPIKFRWLCPSCKFKNSCCEGAPLDAREE